jgi:uncharacterized protein (TIGR00297 family)
MVAGAIAAAVVAFAAHRAGSLSLSGAVAAGIVGTIAVAAGWQWGALLIAFFLTSTALSRVGRTAKEASAGGIIEKSGRRDAWQVLANGGVFAVAAIGSIADPSEVWLVMGSGALAACAADTWATEIGMLARETPRSILSGRRVPTGTSGGVTLVGSLAAVLGASFLGAVALVWLRSAGMVMAVVAGGVGGAFADSLIGATLQERRRCGRCGAPTERLMHGCGGATEIVGGVPFLRNDAVNALSSFIGAGVAALLARS